VGIDTSLFGSLGVVIASQRLNPGNILASGYYEANQLFLNATVVYGNGAVDNEVAGADIPCLFIRRSL
jgi:hypothetical protein